jgi:protein TonB
MMNRKLQMHQPAVKTVLVAFLLIMSSMCVAQMGADSISNESQILSTPETMPAFPDGYDKMQKFIAKKLKYPKGKINVRGKVFVQFIVEKDGSITSIRTIMGLHPLLDAEAERVVKLFPKWIPGKIAGEVVSMKMVIPIVFSTTQ